MSVLHYLGLLQQNLSGRSATGLNENATTFEINQTYDYIANVCQTIKHTWLHERIEQPRYVE